MLKKEDIEHLSTLSRVEVSEDEKEDLAGQLDSVLAYVGEIAKIATGGDAMPVPGSLRNVLRDDTDQNPGGEYTDAIIKNAPHHEKGYVQVKRIM